MNIKIALSIMTVLLVSIVSAQNVGIGTSSPAAKLDITSANSGVLIPRVALTGTGSADPLSSPVTSTLVYNTATAGSGATAVAPGFYFWNGSSWVRVIDNNSLGSATSNTLSLSTNTLTSTVNGAAATSSAVSGVGNTWTQATGLTTTVNGVTGNINPASGTITNVLGYNSSGTPVYQAISGLGESVSNTVNLSGNTISTTVDGTTGTAVTVPNIYSTDGTLAATRTVTMGNNNLIFNTSGTGSVVVGTGDATASPVGGTLRAPNAGSGNTTGGGTLNINGGYGYNGTSGGSVIVNGGTTSGSGTNGNVYLRGGYTSPNEGAVYLNDDHSGNTFINAAGGLVTIGKGTVGSAQLSINNGLSVDAAGTNSGSISSLNSATTSNGITFGGSGSGEGLASNRASSANGNQYGVDIYTNFTRRLSVTNTGSVGIGTTSPAVLTEISGATTELLKLTSTSGGAGNHAYIDFVTYSGTYVDARIGAIDMGTNNGSLVFETGNQGSASTTTTERMRILNTGYVGINNTVPSNTLNVGATTGMGSGIDIGIPNDQYGNNGSSYAIRFYGYRDVESYIITAKIAAQRTYQCCAGSGSTPWLEQGSDLVFSTTNAPATAGTAGAPADNTTERMRIKDNGNVGIGTSSPGYPLDIGITTTGSLSGSYGYLAQSGAGTGGSGTGNQTISVHASGRMFALEYDAQSDRRIKTALSHPDAASMLDQADKLKVTDYSYIDKVQRGDQPKRGFIAQEVEQVIPTAVHKNTDVIPSVFAPAEKVSIAHSTLTVTTAAAHGFAEGDEILLYDKASKAYNVKVAVVINDHTFEVYDWTANTDQLFVYGKKVNDFRAVDFDQLTAVAIGAVQELSKKEKEQQAEIEKLKAENDALRTGKVDRADYDRLKASVETLQQIIGSKAEK